MADIPYAPGFSAPYDMTPEAVNYARSQYEAQKQADVARYKKGLQTYVPGPPVGAVSSR